MRYVTYCRHVADHIKLRITVCDAVTANSKEQWFKFSLFHYEGRYNLQNAVCYDLHINYDQYLIHLWHSTK